MGGGALQMRPPRQFSRHCALSIRIPQPDRTLVVSTRQEQHCMKFASMKASYDDAGRGRFIHSHNEVRRYPFQTSEAHHLF